MRHRHQLPFAFLFLFAAACGDDPPAERAPAKHIPVAPEVAVGRPVDLSIGPFLAMEHPLRDGKLALVPIVETAHQETRRFLTLTDGLARHVVTVREIGRNDNFVVDQVRIRNKSREPLFVMTGEMIIDGLQDRVIAEDKVIEPGKTVRVSVRCVELGREDGTKTFHARGLVTELGLRQTIVHDTQQAVWAKIDTINAALGLHPGTKTYRGVALRQLTVPAMVERREHLAQQLAALPDHDKIVGLAAVLDGQVIAVDRFASPELFASLESELLGSYVASDDGVPHEGRTFLPDDVRALAAGDHASTEASYTAIRK